MLSNFFKISKLIFLEYKISGCSPVNLPHIFRTPFSENTSGRQLLYINTNVLFSYAIISAYFLYDIHVK